MKKIFLLLAVVLGLTSLAFAEEAAWKRDLYLGYDQANGNTNQSQLNLGAAVAKGWRHSDFSSKFDFFYSSSDKKMDGQKWISSIRYALNFGKDDRWFNPYQIAVDHDKFSDVKTRYLPSVGLGYWLFKSDDFKWSLEDSIGYEITDYYNAEDKESTSMILRTLLDKVVFGKCHLTEEFSFIPSLEGEGNRIKSETGFSNPLMKNLDLTLRYLIDYEDQPAADKKKSDTRLVVGLKYSF